MQRTFPVRSRERITSCDNLNRYLAALSPSSAAGQASARGLSPPEDGSAVDWIGSAAVTSDFITKLVNRWAKTHFPAGWCACAHARNLTTTSAARHFCFLPRKRCYRLSLEEHRKILRLLHGGAIRGCLGFNETKLSEMKTKHFQSNSKRALWRIFRRSSQRHDRMLVLNMALFNFTDGWNRVFSREQYARCSV